MTTPSTVTTSPRDTDYFAFLGLPRKLRIDAGALETKFHQLSWKLHPDNFVNAGAQERELALQRSSQLNDAYRALREPISRVEYLLAIEGVRKEGQQKQQAPPELLEEVFELNESLDELRAAQAGETDTTALRARLAASPPRRKTLNKSSAQWMRGWKPSSANGTPRSIPAATTPRASESCPG